jgi:hypothetical protein
MAQTEQTWTKLERQLANAYQLCKARYMPYEEYATLRDSLNRRLKRLRPVCDEELEAASALLENLPALLKTATPEDLHLIFHATLKAVGLDSQAATPVVAMEFHPTIQRLLDLSQAAAPILVSTESAAAVPQGRLAETGALSPDAEMPLPSS